MKQGNDYLAGIEWSGWPVEDAHRRHADPQRQAAGFIYVLESSDGWIKVGCANNAHNRIRAHAKEADLRGARILRAYVSRPHGTWRENEQELIAACTRLKRPEHGREYFRGLEFAKVAGFAEALPQELPTLEEIAESHRRARAFVEALKIGPAQMAAASSGKSSAELWYKQAQDQVAAIFGRKEDGTYDLGASPLDEKPVTPAQGESLLGSLVDIAEAKGGCVECALEMTAVDMLEDIITTMVKIEAAKLSSYAAAHGHVNMVTAGGDLLKEVLPDDDPRLPTSHVSDEDGETYWDYDPEQGVRLWGPDSEEPIEVVPPAQCWR